MMEMFSILFLMFGSVFIVPADAKENRYFGAVPRILYPGRYTALALSSTQVEKDAQISITLKSKGKVANKYTTILHASQSGVMKRIPFYVPLSLLSSSFCDLEILVKGGLSLYHEVNNLEVRRLKDKILIQTDKPMYKPGGKVKFRVIRIDKDLKPNHKPIEEIFVTNPTGSRIIQWTNITLNTGVISLEMPLSVKPVLGEWKITAKSEDAVVEKFINVKKYVKPKFEVKITSPAYLLTKYKSVTFKICAKYTYGKKISGKLNAKICYKQTENCQTFQKQVNGCGDVTYNVKSASTSSVLKAIATVTEDGSGAAITSTHYTQPFLESDVAMKLEAPKYVKPGMKYTIKVFLNTPDGRPVLEETRVTLLITKPFNFIRTPVVVLKKNITVKNGVYEKDFVPAANNEANEYSYKAICVKGLTQAEGKSFVWYSPSNTYLQITSVSQLKVGQTALVGVSFSSITTQKELNYMVVCKGKLIVASMKHTPPGSKADILFHITQDMVPKCRLLVYYISIDGEFISDNKIVNVESSYRNKVTMAFSSTEKFPGENVDLLLKAEPGSLFAIAAVDKSILLMASNNDVRETELLSFLSEQDVGSSGPHDSVMKCYWRRRILFHRNVVDGVTSVKETGLRYFTNTKVDVVPCPVRYSDLHRTHTPKIKFLIMESPIRFFKQPLRTFFSRPKFSKPRPFLKELPSLNDLPSIKTQKPKTINEKLKTTTITPKIREEFPETWLWLEEIINSSGEKKLSLKIPDTITTWHATGFAISPSDGIGVASSANLRAFQPFFISLSLPYSVKRGETVKIPATVFNYLDKCLVVKVTLKPNKKIVVISELERMLCVCGDSSQTFKFVIKATTLGKIDISVVAQSVSTNAFSNVCNFNSTMENNVAAMDTLTKKLLVEVEGVKKEYSKSIYFCPRDSSFGIYTNTLSLDLPKSIVPGSVFAEVAVTGDLLGPSVDGIGKLLAMPYGCGEQNMLKFAPNIYIMDYLTATKQLTPVLERSAKEYMRSGYQRELTYKHNNGAYSAFGERDKEGSTWLTAFVLRSYAQARKYIFIDPKDIKDSTEWLMSLQLPSGCFKEVGMVHHKELKGGITSGITMTAFVLNALLEAGIERSDSRIQKALKCIERQLDDVDDYYTASVLAFALRFGGSTKAQLMLNKLKDGAITEGGMHWEDKKKIPEKIFWFHHQARSTDIETTAYALLAYLTKEKFGTHHDYLSIVEWLVKQRNSHGGFASTQDTCVALQALSKYAASISVGSFDMEIEAKYSDVKTTFQVNERNKIILQRHQIETGLPLSMNIEATGIGCALIQVNVKYNEPQPGNETSFILHVEVKQDNNSLTCLHKMKVCGSYASKGKSNMGLIDVNMVSGFEPIIHELETAAQSDNVAYTQYEYDDGVLSFYFNEFEQKSQCAEFSIEQVAEVEERKPASLMIYDYYDKDDSATKTYSVGSCPEVNIVS